MKREMKPAAVKRLPERDSCFTDHLIESIDYISDLVAGKKQEEKHRGKTRLIWRPHADPKKGNADPNHMVSCFCRMF